MLHAEEKLQHARQQLFSNKTEENYTVLLHFKSLLMVSNSHTSKPQSKRHLNGPGSSEIFELNIEQCRCRLQMGGSGVKACQVHNKTRLKEASIKISV